MDSAPVPMIKPKPLALPIRQEEAAAERIQDGCGTSNARPETENEDAKAKVFVNKGPDLSKLSIDIKQQLDSVEIPRQEIKLDLNKISDLEKVIHYEYFEDRPTKTPARYLKVRRLICELKT